jgi:hypothetical protein
MLLDVTIYLLWIMSMLSIFGFFFRKHKAQLPNSQVSPVRVSTKDPYHK